MKTFTAIYSTPTLKNINYSFQAKSMADAKRYRKNKFSAKRVKIIEEKQNEKDMKELENQLKDWQGMLETAEMVFKLAKTGSNFTTDDIVSAFKRVQECKTNCNRVQESIDKVINQIKAI